MNQTIKISGLTCSACQKLISKRLMKIDGVESVSVELTGKTDIKAKRTINDIEIKKMLEGTLYQILE